MMQKHPLPEGFTARPARVEDIEQVVDLLNAYAMYTIGAEDYTVEDLKNEWDSPSFSLEKDTQLVLNPEGKAAAFGDLFAWTEIPVSPFSGGYVLPDFEGLGIGSYLLAWAEQRSLEVMDDVPLEAKFTLQAHSMSNHAPAKNLFEDFGMQLFRHSFQMRVDLDAPPEDVVWPGGITLRAYRHPEDLEAVYLAEREAFRDHFGHIEESFEEGFKRFKHHMADGPNFDPAMWFLAMDGDEIAGFSLCRKHSWEDKQMGWVSSLAVLRPWRKRGLGTALLLHSFKVNYEHGFRKVGLGVDGGNLTGALKLYKKAGMYVHRQMDRYRKVIREGIDLSVTELEN